MSRHRPLAAVTGASAGIGEVFARKLAARGYDLLLVARRRGRMEALAAELNGKFETKCDVLGVDLTACEGLREVEARIAGDERLELLVNNAGFGMKGKFWEAPIEVHETMHRLHVMATVRLTHAALRNMTPRDHGGVINVASVAAFVRGLGNVSYCATKSWMNVFTEGLYLELKHSGSKVKVQALCPGFTYTEFHEVMGVDRAVIPKALWMSADFVVEESLRGLEHGKMIVVPARKYKWFSAMVTKLPESWRIAMEMRSPQNKSRV
jgi:short-subunit dehydrogenase